jgi:mRNA-degrading endonuclease toxin of MazEF toxin-antitoxin module
MRTIQVVLEEQLLTVRKDERGRRLGGLSADRTRDVCVALAFALACDG